MCSDTDEDKSCGVEDKIIGGLIVVAGDDLIASRAAGIARRGIERGGRVGTREKNIVEFVVKKAIVGPTRQADIRNPNEIDGDAVNVDEESSENQKYQNHEGRQDHTDGRVGTHTGNNHAHCASTLRK